uniref:Gp1 n=1 Tax=Towan virus TaxID=1892900 RepID=A0A1B3Q5T9_9VIRU|nr:gp1 [Towan virus]
MYFLTTKADTLDMICRIISRVSAFVVKKYIQAADHVHQVVEEHAEEYAPLKCANAVLRVPIAYHNRTAHQIHDFITDYIHESADDMTFVHLSHAMAFAKTLTIPLKVKVCKRMITYAVNRVFDVVDQTRRVCNMLRVVANPTEDNLAALVSASEVREKSLRRLVVEHPFITGCASLAVVSYLLAKWKIVKYHEQRLAAITDRNLEQVAATRTTWCRWPDREYRDEVMLIIHDPAIEKEDRRPRTFPSFAGKQVIVRGKTKTTELVRFEDSERGEVPVQIPILPPSSSGLRCFISNWRFRIQGPLKCWLQSSYKLEFRLYKLPTAIMSQALNQILIVNDPHQLYEYLTLHICRSMDYNVNFEDKVALIETCLLQHYLIRSRYNTSEFEIPLECFQ